MLVNSLLIYAMSENFVAGCIRHFKKANFAKISV